MLKWLCAYLKSSIGKKQLMAVTGLLLCGFLVTHLIGNFLLMVGPEVFNRYSYGLINNPLIIPAEIGLLTLFLVHIGLAINVVIENRRSRPQGYYVKTKTGRGATLASSTMAYTGIITLAFVVLHVINFKFGTYYTIAYDNVEMRDLHRLVIEFFQSPAYVGWYIFAVCSLGLHVSHGLASAFQTLGLHHPKYFPVLNIISRCFGIFVALGYSALPIWAYFQGGN